MLAGLAPNTPMTTKPHVSPTEFAYMGFDFKETKSAEGMRHFKPHLWTAVIFTALSPRPLWTGLVVAAE